MNNHVRDLAYKLLRTSFDLLPEHEQQMIRRVAERVHISRNTNQEFEQGLTFGQRLADRVAAFGGSWPFILLFCFFLVVWVVTNSFILAARGGALDPSLHPAQSIPLHAGGVADAGDYDVAEPTGSEGPHGRCARLRGEPESRVGNPRPAPEARRVAGAYIGHGRPVPWQRGLLSHLRGLASRQ